MEIFDESRMTRGHADRCNSKGRAGLRAEPARPGSLLVLGLVFEGAEERELGTVFVGLDGHGVLAREAAVADASLSLGRRDLPQPFHVAEQFTGTAGVYVRLEDTIRGFKEVLEGKHDDLPEQAFYMVGTIEDAQKKAETLA